MLAAAVLFGAGLPAMAGETTAALPCEAVPAAFADEVPEFPLQAAPGGRYLRDARGRPFFIHGDTPWSLIAQLGPAEVELYIADRRRRGFNTILVNLIEHRFAANAPVGGSGEAPFLASGDFSTPNDAYFDYAEWVVGRARAAGLLVLLTPAYMGYRGGGEGWYQAMLASGTDALRAYGRYIARRFRDHPNVIWVHGGDHDPPEREVLRAVPEGMREVLPRALHTFHGARGTSALGFLGPEEPWLGLNTIYTDEHTVVDAAWKEFRRSPSPFILIEARYEGERGADALTVRRQAWQAALSGAAGHLVGNRPVWLFDAGWKEALDSEGARTIGHLRRFMGSVGWWRFRPDTEGRLLVGGRGRGILRAATAVRDDRSEALIYLPAPRPLRLDLAELAGPVVTASWHPAAGGPCLPEENELRQRTVVALGPPPGVSAAGTEDWVLRLRSGP